jgi:hypothetical protein
MTEVYFCHQNQNAQTIGILTTLLEAHNIGTHLKGIETSFQVIPLLTPKKGPPFTTNFHVQTIVIKPWPESIGIVTEQLSYLNAVNTSCKHYNMPLCIDPWIANLAPYSSEKFGQTLYTNLCKICMHSTLEIVWHLETRL